MNHINYLYITLLLLCACSSQEQNNYIDLDGSWNFRLDREDVGVANEWYTENLEEKVSLPGSLNTNGIGDDVTKDTPWTGSIWNRVWYESDFYAKYRTDDNTKTVFWLTPDKYYVGVAWYQKQITIPEEWANKSLQLQLERCHWETTVWVDSTVVGMQNSLAVPHRYNLPLLAVGDHTITVRVDNRTKEIDPGADAHSISDNTQSNWNGIVGDMRITALPQAHIKGVKIEPLFQDKKIIVSLDIDTPSPTLGELTLQVTPVGRKGKSLQTDVHTVTLDSSSCIELVYDMGSDFAHWDEFNPNLYTLAATLTTPHGTTSKESNFGIRELTTDGTRICVNGNPVFFRGTLECCIFPKTGFPPTDEAEWERIMNICKAHGLNHIRFHSWCPPRAAFNAADKLGIYLYIECSSWASDIGSGKGIDQYIMEESERIVAEYGNHPSFCLFGYGNEPHGKEHVAYLREFVNYWKARDNRFLHTTGAGWPAIDECDWHSIQKPRIQRWGEGVKSIINGEAPCSTYDWSELISANRPTITHEIGQWCVYPNLKEREKYTGVFKAKNFDIFEDRLADNNLLHLADDFLMASGKLQTLCYKADIEAALRTDGQAGFQLLDLHDFPGQGSAIVGVLDPFWDSKPYVTPSEYREFCNEVVPLARMERFVYTSGDTLQAAIEVAQYSSSDMENPTIKWQLIDRQNACVAGGTLACSLLKKGALHKVGSINLPLHAENPQQLQLVVTVNDYTNRWNIWVYPNEVVPANEILVTNKIDAAVRKTLAQGGSVLLTPTLGTLKNEGADSVVVGFSSIFWNTMWTNGQPPHTLGILCNEAHPALALFPTSYHSDYQWWDAMAHCNAIPLHKLGEGVEPIVRIIDDWFTARSLGLIVEAKVGSGKLILTGVDLLTNKENRPEAIQLKNSLLAYMQSDAFDPQTAVSLERIETLFKDK